MPSWTLGKVNAYYLMGIPPPLRSRWGLQPGGTVYLRDLGPIALVAPLTVFPMGRLTEHEMDLIVARLANQWWTPAAQLNPTTAVRIMEERPRTEVVDAAVDLVEQRTPPPPPEAAAAPVRGVAVAEMLAAVNKKGFLVVPEVMKAHLGLTYESTFSCEIRRDEDGSECLVIKPIRGMAEVRAFEQTAMARSAVRAQAARVEEERAAVAAQAAEQAETDTRRRAREALRAPATTPGPPPWKAYGDNPLPRPPLGKLMPTEAPIEGHVWHEHTDGSWVQVPDMSDDA